MDFFILDHCEGLQNQLGVTVEEPWFPNPYDPARKVLYSYDFWHSIRNLRYVIWRKKILFSLNKEAHGMYLMRSPYLFLYGVGVA